MSLVDTHCHLDFEAFDDDRPQVIARAAEAGVRRILNPAIDLSSCAVIMRLSEQYEGVYAAIGIHPNSTSSYSPEHLGALLGYARHVKVLAVGEIGLDYYWDKSPRPVQIAAFEAQLALAAQAALPVIIHNREAGDDVISILEHWVNTLPSTLRERPGVLHSFSGSLAMAERALRAGFYLGFTGPLTYKNADETRRIAAAVPLNRLLVETDAPFLTPVPHRGKRNEPAYIPLMVERLASIRQLEIEEVAQATTTNAEQLFNLPAQ